jgi:transposase
MAAVHAEDEAVDPPASRAAKPRKTNRGSLPQPLPHIEEVLEPEPMPCGCGAERHAPARLIPGGMPTEATVAHVLVSKYADHMPLYRQAQIYSRQGIDLDRSTLAGWVGKAAYELRPVYDALIADLKGSTKLFMPSRQHALHAPAG